MKFDHREYEKKQVFSQFDPFFEGAGQDEMSRYDESVRGKMQELKELISTEELVSPSDAEYLKKCRIVKQQTLVSIQNLIPDLINIKLRLEKDEEPRIELESVQKLGALLKDANKYRATFYENPHMQYFMIRENELVGKISVLVSQILNPEMVERGDGEIGVKEVESLIV